LLQPGAIVNRYCQWSKSWCVSADASAFIVTATSTAQDKAGWPTLQLTGAMQVVEK